MADISNPPVPDLPAVYIPNQRTRVDAVSIHTNIHLTAIRDWLGLHSNLLCDREFSAHCTRIGAAHLSGPIRVLLCGPVDVSFAAATIVNNYACIVSGLPAGTFDNALSDEMETIKEAFHEQCDWRVARCLREIATVYQRHQEELRVEDEFFANGAAEQDALPDSNEPREQEPHANQNGVMFQDDDDFLYAQNQWEDERAEALMEDYRQEMAERYGDAMDDEGADEGADEDSFRNDAADEHEIRMERVAEVAQDLRNAQAAYNRVRKEARAERDATLPLTVGVWVMVPTADGRSVEPSFEEHATVEDVRTKADGCPWPFFVYENHVKAELAKGTDCPISLVPLRECTSVNVSMNCGHIYDTKSIVAWTKINTPALCPCCRAPIAGMWQMRDLGKEVPVLPTNK